MEPHNTTPENNLNAPPVGPMPEPLPPEPTPPAPVVPEPPEPEPAPAPTPESTPEPAPAPAPAPTEQPVLPAQPQPQPQPTAPTQTPSPAPTPKKKLSGGAIAGIVIASIIAIAGIILGILTATGTLNWSQIFAGIGLGGSEGNPFSNSPTPTVSLAESTCKNHGGTFSDVTYKMENSMPSDREVPDILGAYNCDFEGSAQNNSNAVEFELILIDDNMVDYFDEIGSFPSSANILENSDEMIKFIDYKTDKYVEYYVLYKNAEVMLIAPNYDIAEQALVELGFPNRSKAN